MKLAFLNYSFIYLASLVIWNTETHTERETETKIFILLVNSPNAWNRWVLARWKSGARKLTWLSHVGYRNPTTWDIIYCLPGSILKGRWNWKWRQDSNPSTLTWDESMNSDIFTSVPNAHNQVIYSWQKWQEHTTECE